MNDEVYDWKIDRPASMLFIEAVGQLSNEAQKLMFASWPPVVSMTICGHPVSMEKLLIYMEDAFKEAVQEEARKQFEEKHDDILEALSESIKDLFKPGDSNE